MSKEEVYSKTAHAFIKAGRMHRAYCDRLVSKTGLHRNQHKILMMLTCGQGKPSQKELAKKLEISTAAVAVIIKKLEQSGYITKTSARADGRFNEIEITPKGRSIVEKSKEYFTDCDRILFRGFQAQEIAALEAYMIKISENLADAMKEEIL